jgi:hypothetical protein
MAASETCSAGAPTSDCLSLVAGSTEPGFPDQGMVRLLVFSEG